MKDAQRDTGIPFMCKLSNCVAMLIIVINKVWISTALFYKILEKE